MYREWHVTATDKSSGGRMILEFRAKENKIHLLVR
jgi:hypothetical protein